MKKRRLHLYTAAMLFACTYSLHGQTTYTDGVFMLNEDWYGHNNSTLNFIRPDHPTDPFEYYIIQNNESNAGQSLGATAQFGAVYGSYLFIISKQDQDAGDGLSPGESAETRQGGRIVVADAQTMEIKSRIPIIRANEKGVSIADGRSFVGVDETKGYVGTSNGIYILSFSPFEITGRIEGTENPLITGDEDNADGVGPLYQNQIGMMLRTADYVFAIQQDKGVLVIDPQTDKIIPWRDASAPWRKARTETSGWHAYPTWTISITPTATWGRAVNVGRARNSCTSTLKRSRPKPSP